MKPKNKISVEKIFNTPLPPRLHHYTSSAGLIGILKTNKIWTTKIHYLNDRSELNFAFEHIRTEIEHQLKKKKGTRGHEDLEEMLRILETIEKINVSVASFTEEGDQLSQWRGYCKVGDGYSLGFDGKVLRQQLREQFKWGFYLVPCVYSKTEHEVLTRELVKHSPLRALPPNPELINWPLRYFSFEKASLLIAPMIKAIGFKEEKEWRLISPPLSYNTAEFRRGNFSLIPYWETELNLEQTLKEIVIGPTPEQELSESAVRGLLMKYFPSQNSTIREVKISHSQPPFRNL
jgi:hypothetical protein